jgi:hypothetical protein
MTPELAGQYVITSEHGSQTRMARIDEHEITDPPGTLRPATRGSPGAASASAVDASPELALVLLAGFALELTLRIGSEARRRRRSARALQ